MSTARKFKPGWDNAFFLERTLPDREGTPRLPATIIKLPKRSKFDLARAVEGWAAIGLKNDAKWILEHNTQLRRWGKRINAR